MESLGFDFSDDQKEDIKINEEEADNSQEINTSDDSRITSYNVCYTKLLRKGS